MASGDGKQIVATYNLPKRFDDASITVVLLWDIGTRAVRAKFVYSVSRVDSGASHAS